MAFFKWTKTRVKAALLLANGDTIDETANSVGVSSRTIDRWKSDIEFSQEVDRLSVMIGVASRAERLRIAKRVIKKLVRQDVPTDKDLLDWLKYAQGETDGIKLDLTAIIEALSSVADSRPDGVPTAEEEKAE